MFGMDQFSNNFDNSLFESSEMRQRRNSRSPATSEESSLHTEVSNTSWLTSNNKDAGLSFGLSENDLSFFQKPNLSVPLTEKSSFTSTLRSDSFHSLSPTQTRHLIHPNVESYDSSEFEELYTYQPQPSMQGGRNHGLNEFGELPLAPTLSMSNQKQQQILAPPKVALNVYGQAFEPLLSHNAQRGFNNPPPFRQQSPKYPPVQGQGGFGGPGNFAGGAGNFPNAQAPRPQYQNMHYNPANQPPVYNQQQQMNVAPRPFPSQMVGGQQQQQGGFVAQGGAGRGGRGGYGQQGGFNQGGPHAGGRYNNNTYQNAYNNPGAGLGAAYGMQGQSGMGGGGDGGVYVIQHKNAFRNYMLHPQAPQNVGVGDFVIVDGDRGEDIGVVTDILTMMAFIEMKYLAGGGLDEDSNSVGQILRIASAYERQQLPAKFHDEQTVVKYCQEIANNLYFIPIIVLDAEFQLDRHKLTIYYDTNVRIDFRELVRDLYSTYKTRIWMKQVEEHKPFYPKQSATMALATGVLFNTEK